MDAYDKLQARFAELQDRISALETSHKALSIQADQWTDLLSSRLSVLEAKQVPRTIFNWKEMADERLAEVEHLEATVRELTRQRDNAWNAIDKYSGEIVELKDDRNRLRDQLTAASQERKTQLTVNNNLAAEVNRLRLVILDALSVLNRDRQPLLTIDRIELAAKLVFTINADVDDK